MKTPAPLFKFLHLAAMVPFLGGIAACIVLDATGHLDQPMEFVLRRRIASDLSWALIIPGMCALVASGAALAWRGRADGLSHAWLGAKTILGLLILGNGFLLIMPRLRDITSLVRSSTPDLVLAASLQRSEDILGGANLVLAIAAFVLAVYWPSHKSPPAPLAHA